MSSVASGSGQRFLGVTPPIALNGPTARDNEVSVSLLDELKKQGVFETEAEAKVRCVCLCWRVLPATSRRRSIFAHRNVSSVREVVLSKVDAMVKDFVYRASLSRGLSESIAATSGGKIFSFVSGKCCQVEL